MFFLGEWLGIIHDYQDALRLDCPSVPGVPVRRQHSMIIANSGRVAVAGNVFCVFQATLGSVFSGPESGPACCGKTHSVTRKWARFLVTQSMSFFLSAACFSGTGGGWPGVSESCLCGDPLTLP